MKSWTKLAEIGKIPLTDREYLEELIIYLYRFRSNQIYSIKDTTSACVAITPIFAKMLGFDSLDKVLGKKDEEMPCKTAEFAEIFYQQDREVEQTKKTKQTVNILEYNTGVALLKCIKEPIVNPATNNILGVSAWETTFTLNTPLKTILGIHGERFGGQPSLNIIENAKEFDLTKRELEVLYCVCLGLSDRKAIANFLSFIYKKNINPDTTVKDAISRLYNKFPCHSISMLAEYAISKGLHLRIPNSFVREGSFELTQETPIIG